MVDTTRQRNIETVEADGLVRGHWYYRETRGVRTTTHFAVNRVRVSNAFDCFISSASRGLTGTPRI